MDKDKVKRYSYEEKLKAVMLVIKEHRSMESVAREIGCDRKAVNLWKTKYKHFGNKGLLSKKNKNYDAEFKLSVVKYMNENHLTFLETAMTFGIPEPTIVLRWKRKYEKEGGSSFMPDNGNEELRKRKGGLEDKTKEELIKRIEYLEVEVAYLKKLRDLVQKKEAIRTGKRQKPSEN